MAEIIVVMLIIFIAILGRVIVPYLEEMQYRDDTDESLEWTLYRLSEEGEFQVEDEIVAERYLHSLLGYLRGRSSQEGDLWDEYGKAVNWLLTKNRENNGEN